MQDSISWTAVFAVSAVGWLLVIAAKYYSWKRDSK